MHIKCNYEESIYVMKEKMRMRKKRNRYLSLAVVSPR